MGVWQGLIHSRYSHALPFSTTSTHTTFALDFGEHRDAYVTLQTDRGEAISRQIAGYIDIFLKKRIAGGTMVVETEGEIADVEMIAVPITHTMTSTTTTAFGGGVMEGASQGQISGGSQIPGKVFFFPRFLLLTFLH